MNENKTIIEEFMKEHKGEYCKSKEKIVNCGRTDCIHNKPILSSLYKYKVLKLIDKDDIKRGCSKKFVGINENGKCFSYKKENKE